MSIPESKGQLSSDPERDMNDTPTDMECMCDDNKQTEFSNSTTDTTETGFYSNNYNTSVSLNSSKASETSDYPIACKSVHSEPLRLRPQLSEQFSVEESRLDNLPAEIFLHICTFIKAKFVINTLSQVCKHFHTLINDNVFWKTRLRLQFKKKYPVIPVNSKIFNWKQACIEREEQHNYWSDPDNKMDFFMYTDGLSAPVDIVHLMKDASLLAIGSRDRCLNIVDLTKLDPNDKSSMNSASIICRPKAHLGWIWSITSQENILATGAWDRYIRFWDLERDGAEVGSVKCKSAVLCTHFQPNFFVAGSYDKRVYHIDPRDPAIINEKVYHKKPVLCMSADDKYILTGSEDKTICIYDRRADKVYKSLQIENGQGAGENYPLCMSYGMDQLWVGDKHGSVHLIDASDGDFDMVETFNVGHTRKVTGIIHTLGSIFTCSVDKTIKVLEPSLDPDVITTLTKQNAEISRIDFQNDTLVSAGCDVSVGIWRPKV